LYVAFGDKKHIRDAKYVGCRRKHTQMKRTRRTETRIETHEIKIIRFGKRIDADDETLTDLELLPAPKLIGDEEKDLCPRKTRKDAK